MQSASLIRIFYEGCSLLSWLGHQEQYTVKLGYTNLNTDTIQTQTCPSPTSAPIQAPAVKCESANMTVTLAAKELQVARFIDLDASSFQEKIMKEGGGLTQWTDGENLVVQVEKPTMEDQGVLLLHYTDISDKLNTAKVFCPQHQPKLQRRIHMRNKYKHSGNAHHALEPSEHSVFLRPPFIQWAMPVFMSEPYRPSPRLATSFTSPETTRTPAHSTEVKMDIDIPVTTTPADTIIKTATVSVPSTAAAEITVSASTPALNTSALTTATTRGITTTPTTQHNATTSNLSGVFWGLLTNDKPLTISANKQPFAEQTSAKNPSDFNNEAQHQSGPKLASSEYMPQTTTATTSIQTSSAKSNTSATTKTSAESRTFSSTNKELYTSNVGIKTPPAAAEVFGSTAATTPSTKPCNAETATAQTRRNEEHRFTTKEQTSAANPSNNSNETTLESGPILVSTATSTQPSMTSNAANTTNATAKTTKTSTEPGTTSNTNTELYTTDVEMKTSPAATHANTNPIPVNFAGSTTSSTESVTIVHGAETTEIIDSKTEAKTSITTPTNMTYSETNTIAWTSATATPGASGNPAVSGPVTTTTISMALSPTAPVMNNEATATTASKTSTVERVMTGTATAADSSGNTTTEFKSLSTKLSTTASTPSSTKSTSTEVPGSPGSVIPLTTSAVNILATATQTMLTAARFTFTSPKSATVPESTPSVDSASTTLTDDVHLSTLIHPSSANTTTSTVMSVSSTSGGDVAETTISTAVITSTVLTAQTPIDLTHTPLFGYILTTSTPEAEVTTNRRTTTSSAATATTHAENSSTAVNATTIPSGVSTLLVTNTSVETSAKVTSIDENIISIPANSAKMTTASNFESMSTMTPKTPTEAEDASVLSTSTSTALAAGPSTPANIFTADTQSVDTPLTPGAAEVLGSTTATITPPTKPCNYETAMAQTSRNEEQGITLDFDNIFWGFPGPFVP